MLRLIPQPPGRIAGGQVLFQDRDLLKLPAEEIRQVRGNDIAMIFQDPMTSLDPVLTINKQISETLQVHLGMSAKQARERSIELLDAVNIPEAEARIDNYPHQFSGGMRQRVMIAIALSCDPQLLIADEPTTALDVTIQAQIIDLVQQLRTERGMSIIWITHDLGIIAGLVDRVQVMYAGYIVEKAEVEDLYENPRHPYTMGLLASLPRVDAKQRKQLTPIEGLPPDLIHIPQGCPFHPRCMYRIPRCLKENPQLRTVGPGGHQMACWVDLTEE
jgi:oligopeptide transport system ATP-binding protein